MPKPLAQPGEKFTKAGNTPTHWVVDRVLEYADIPPHVRLVQRNNEFRSITVAASVLNDPKHFVRSEN